MDTKRHDCEEVIQRFSHREMFYRFLQPTKHISHVNIFLPEETFVTIFLFHRVGHMRYEKLCYPTYLVVLELTLLFLLMLISMQYIVFHSDVVHHALAIHDHSIK